MAMNPMLVSTWTDLPDGAMHALAGAVVSARPAVVLVHGMVVSSRYMAPLAEHLAPRANVYAPDLPGYGQSYKPWPVLSVPELADALAAWMNRRNIERAHFVANSFGCQVLVELALRHPMRIDRLVLQGPTADPAPRSAAARATGSRRCP